MVLILVEQRFSKFGLLTGRGKDLGPVRFHHSSSAGLLVVADSDHVDPALQVEDRGSKGESRSPLASPGLGH